MQPELKFSIRVWSDCQHKQPLLLFISSCSLLLLPERGHCSTGLCSCSHRGFTFSKWFQMIGWGFSHSKYPTGLQSSQKKGQRQQLLFLWKWNHRIICITNSSGGNVLPFCWFFFFFSCFCERGCLWGRKSSALVLDWRWGRVLRQLPARPWCCSAGAGEGKPRNVMKCWAHRSWAQMEIFLNWSGSGLKAVCRGMFSVCVHCDLVCFQKFNC